MMADQEIEHRLTSTVSGLRRGIASTRGSHASLRSEAKALKDFIPMLVEGARSGITSLLKHQASVAAYAHSFLCLWPVAFGRRCGIRIRNSLYVNNFGNLPAVFTANLKVHARLRLTAGAASVWSNCKSAAG